MSIDGVLSREKDRPAYVRFERVAMEDKAASLKAGHYVAKDVDLALITPLGSKDIFKIGIKQWKSNMEQDVKNGRLPSEWKEKYIQAYDQWNQGQEIPLDGTPIKGWGVISPAQQETLVKLNVRTVEDLAAINDEGLRRIGMGAVDLKNKAKAWLSQLQDKGPLTQEVASLKSQNATLKANVDTLTEQVQQLSSQLKALAPRAVETQAEEITASDIIEVPEKRGPGRPRKQ